MANGRLQHSGQPISRVLPGDVGGSFGMKSGVHVEVVLVAWAARKLERPVRWTSERTEGFLTDEQARKCASSLSLAGREQQITALKLRWNPSGSVLFRPLRLAGRQCWSIAGTLHHPAISAEVCGY